MPGIKKYLLWLLFLLGNCMLICAQPGDTGQPADTSRVSSSVIPNHFLTDTINRSFEDSVFTIRNIYIVGNKITRRVIMLRELPFREGDSVNIKDLPGLLTEAQTRLLNLSLFSRSAKDFSIKVLDVEGAFMDIIISVKERGYLLPAPHLKPVDRSLSDWLFNNNAQISRLDYGLKLSYNNVSGNNDKLRFNFITGYTKQLQLSYSRPYIDSNLKWGINLSLSLGKTHEVNTGTLMSNKPDFIGGGGNEYLRNFFKGALELTYRPEFYTIHLFGLGYQTLKVGDTVLKRNPYFLNRGITSVNYPEVYYKLVFRNLDNIPYPTKGYAAELLASKIGFSSKMNVWHFTAKGVGYWHLGNPKTFYSISALGSLKLPQKQPFYTSQLLGYGDLTMSGYEYYVIDGTAGGLIKSTLAKQVTNFSIKPPIFKRWLASLIPLKIYGKVYGNAGYAHNPQPWATGLNNRMLYGGGFGLDIFTDYDFTLRLEFSFNHLGESRFYSEKKAIF